MVWVWIFLGIGLAGVVMLVCHGVWLAHKASDLFSEVEQLGKRGTEAAALLAEVKIPERLQEFAARPAGE